MLAPPLEPGLVAAERSHAIDDADKGYDRTALVLLHIALASPVFLNVKFSRPGTMCSQLGVRSGSQPATP